MLDRIPSPGKEGRMLITPEDGSPAFYATVTMADEPLQEGTLLAKRTLLEDAVAERHGRDHTAVPSDIFRVLPLANAGHVLITTKDQNGAILPSVPVLIDGEYAGDTGILGEAMFAVPFGRHEVTVVKTLDIESIEPNVTTLDVYSSDAFRIDAVGVTSDITEVEITETGITGFSGRVADFDICVCGGGAGGVAQYAETSANLDVSAPGSGGGYVTNLFDLSAAAYRAFLATIGAGGAGGQVPYVFNSTTYSREIGKNGGASSIRSLLTQTEHFADGGVAFDPGGSTFGNTGGVGGSGGGGAYVQTAAPVGYAACDSGEDGSDGESRNDGVNKACAGGSGQGKTTRPFEDAGRTPLSPGGGAAAALNGNVVLGGVQAEGSLAVYNLAVGSDAVEAKPGTVWGAGGGAFIALITSNSGGSAKAADGVQGVVIARWRLAQ